MAYLDATFDEEVYWASRRTSLEEAEDLQRRFAEAYPSVAAWAMRGRRAGMTYPRLSSTCT